MSGSQADGEVSAADGDDELEEYSDSDHNGSRRGSEYNGLEDSWISEQKVEVESDLFVACAWNGVTYMIDWSQRGFSSADKPQGAATKFQLVKFASKAECVPLLQVSQLCPISSLIWWC